MLLKNVQRKAHQPVSVLVQLLELLYNMTLFLIFPDQDDFEHLQAAVDDLETFEHDTFIKNRKESLGDESDELQRGNVEDRHIFDIFSGPGKIKKQHDDFVSIFLNQF